MNLSRLREEFPITERVAFLDNASVAPVSLYAKARIDEYLDDAVNIARPAGKKWSRTLDAARAAAARLLGCRRDEVAFAGSTSMGLSLFAGSLDWRVGDSVVVAANEFPANMYAWLNLTRQGVRVKRVPPTHQGRVLIEDLMAAVDSRTRVVAISWVGFNTGYRCDLARLGSECKRRGVLLVVDAIQGLGAFDMRLSDWNVAAAAADAHKWLLGPEGIALLYVSREVVESLHPRVVGWKSIEKAFDFMHYDFTLAPRALRFEPGSDNTIGIHGLLGALELIEKIGMKTITARVKLLTGYLVERLSARGIEVLSPRGGSEWSGIVSFRAPGGDGPAFIRKLEKKGIIVTGRQDFLRVSPHCYNSTEEIDRLLENL